MTERILEILSPTDNQEIAYLTKIEIVNNDSRIINSRINPNMYRMGHEPTIDAISDYLEGIFGTSRRRSRYNSNDNPKEFTHIIKIGESGFICMFHKKGIRYFLNGMSASKVILIRALARTVYKSCFTKEGSELDKYLYKNIHTPENVSYALENRAPFHWYKDGTKTECRFRVNMISDNECAMEISDGVWCPISIKDLNIYMEYYWKGNKRGSWKHLSPSRLWNKLLGEYPKDSQQKLMLAFLAQNRTKDLVEQRAEELMLELSELHKERIKIVERLVDDKKSTYMFVRGKVADWVITNSSYKTDIQMVSTFIYNSVQGSSNIYKIKFGEGYLGGAICIDNMTRHSSIGDQFCARALALLNDELTIELVNTIKRYISDNHISGQSTDRLDFNNLDNVVDEYLKTGEE
tara:strand:- start:12601 stop:13821 length:1221 start_codon:yes stop_codon:yes gene_type:complete